VEPLGKPGTPGLRIQPAAAQQDLLDGQGKPAGEEVFEHRLRVDGPAGRRKDVDPREPDQRGGPSVGETRYGRELGIQPRGAGGGDQGRGREGPALGEEQPVRGRRVAPAHHTSEARQEVALGLGLGGALRQGGAEVGREIPVRSSRTAGHAGEPAGEELGRAEDPARIKPRSREHGFGVTAQERRDGEGRRGHLPLVVRARGPGPGQTEQVPRGAVLEEQVVVAVVDRRARGDPVHGGR